MSTSSIIELEQGVAINHSGSHARLLAGPGTGKTRVLTDRVLHLISSENIQPETILVLTFTRAAASELRGRIRAGLSDEVKPPNISTLHSFALRQLLKNSDKIDSFPRPLRIASDWDEDTVIVEDLKVAMDITKKEIEDKFNLLSADWEKLSADDASWEANFHDPKFLGLWKEHRGIYGYTLRSELTYQLKKAIEQVGDFELESNIKYLLIDEYQDLNKCDLAIISSITERGAELYCAGDDDQSIYGFRHAYPNGIRNFLKDYEPSTNLTLSTCIRCDKEILKISSFIANLDPNRIEKELHPREDALEGDVYTLRFDNEFKESEGIAKLCKYYIDHREMDPQDILILLRSDRNRLYSDLLGSKLENESVPWTVSAGSNILDLEYFQLFNSYLRLINNIEDSLALRTLLNLRDNNIGTKGHLSIYNIAKENGISYSAAANMISGEPDILKVFGKRISDEMKSILKLIEDEVKIFSESGENENTLIDKIELLAKKVMDNEDEITAIIGFFKLILTESDVENLEKLISLISASSDDTEQEQEEGKINIMTMHKAKGLTSKMVILAALEDELIPGSQTGSKLDDERRLLYVSLTRAKHVLITTYCDKRLSQQKFSGKSPGKQRRNLTRFLEDSPIEVQNGDLVIENLINDHEKT